MENYGGVRARNTTYTHILCTEVCVPTTNTCTQHFTNLYIYVYDTYCRHNVYVYRRTIICVCFRSGDEFLRDVRPDRTNRAFLILLLLFYARALHILRLNYTAVGRTRCGHVTRVTVRQDLRPFDGFPII